VKCMDYEVEGVRLETGKENNNCGSRKNCQILKLYNGDAVDHSKWRKLIKDVA